MKKELLNKFSKYAALAGATVIAGNANADIVYTDVDPDSLISRGDTVSIDIDVDGAGDFFLYINDATSYNLAKLQAYNPQNQAVGYFSSTYKYMSALSTSVSVNSSAAFKVLDGNAGIGWGSSNNYYGQFENTTGKYLGVQFVKNTNIHYGWIRIDVSTKIDSITIRDFAYNDIAGSSILTKIPVIADTAQSLVLADTANNISPLDMELNFNAAADENGVLEYRAFVVKTADIASVDLDSARNVNNYAPITPDGSASYSISPEIGGQDVNGDSIVHGVSYTAFVLSVPDGTNATNHSLASSNELMLTYPAETASSLTATDVADNYNGSDLEVAFNMINNEASISEYTVFVVKSANSSSFNLAAAEGNANGISITPTGNNITQVLPITAKDTDGDLITSGVPYEVFVLSVGIDGATNSLSNKSNEITLNGVDAINKSLFKNTLITNNQSILNVNSDIVIESISIFDINGSLITLENANAKQLSVNINKMNSGIYFAVLNTEKGVFNHKFVK